MIFTLFDVFLYVENERRERFDEIICIDVATEIANEINEFLDNSESVIDLDIENFVVVFDEIVVEIVNEIDEIVDEILFLFLLKFRFETNLFIFFVA